MAVTCPMCALELPMMPGPYTTCPRCVPEPDVAGRIAGELVEAALSRADAATSLSLLSTAEAWRSVARAAAER